VAVVKRGKVWQVQVRVGKDAGGRWIRRSATCDTKAEAERMERKLLAEAEANRARFVQPTGDTLGDFINDWWERKRPRLRAGTAANYEAMLRLHILPALGTVKLADLSPRKVQKWLDGREASERTKDVRRLLVSVLKDAEKLGLVATNAAARADAPHHEGTKRGSFTLDEVNAILKAAEGYRTAHLFRFAVFTGLRRGELLGLKWSDVDFDGATVTVCRQVVAVHGKALVQENTKTAAGTREVPLVLQAIAALKAQQAMLKREGVVSPWVFCAADGGLMWPGAVSRAFSRAVKRAGVTPWPLHSTRHTTASILLGAGVEPALCAKVMGHKNLATFYATYADLLKPAGQQVARQVERFLAEAAGETPKRRPRRVR